MWNVYICPRCFRRAVNELTFPHALGGKSLLLHVPAPSPASFSSSTSFVITLSILEDDKPHDLDMKTRTPSIFGVSLMMVSLFLSCSSSSLAFEWALS